MTRAGQILMAEESLYLQGAESENGCTLLMWANSQTVKGIVVMVSHIYLWV